MPLRGPVHSLHWAEPKRICWAEFTHLAMFLPRRTRRRSARRRRHGDNAGVDLARIGWLTTVLACLVAAVLLLAQGYYGYGGVCLAVSAAAAINLI